MQQPSRCPKCGTPIQYGQTFCQYCGTLLSTGCPYCGTAISSGARICPACGASANTGVPQQSGWNTQQQGWYTQQRNWNAQQPGWNTHQSSWWQRSGWGVSATGIRKSSTLYLLFIVLALIVIGLGSFIFLQFGTVKPDASLPAISGVAVTFKGKTSAQIVWRTDKPCSSQVEYGRSSQYGFLEPAVPSNDPSTGKSIGVTSHFVTLTSLKAGYTYHYRVKSKDAAGQEAVSANFSFKTDEPAPFITPE